MTPGQRANSPRILNSPRPLTRALHRELEPNLGAGVALRGYTPSLGPFIADQSRLTLPKASVLVAVAEGTDDDRCLCFYCKEIAMASVVCTESLMFLFLGWLAVAQCPTTSRVHHKEHSDLFFSCKEIKRCFVCVDGRVIFNF